MYIRASDTLRVVVEVVPDALRNEPNYKQNPSEPVLISYHLDNQGKITE